MKIYCDSLMVNDGLVYVRICLGMVLCMHIVIDDMLINLCRMLGITTIQMDRN